MVVTTGQRTEQIGARAQEALRLPAVARVTIARRFFARHTQGAGPLGLGRAVVDFVDWELRSGRLADDGSAWWRCVNGVMMLDLRDAANAFDRDHAVSGTASAWVAYACGDLADAQAHLWDAHQASLTAGLRYAEPLLAAEPEAERELAAIVVAVVERVAADRAPTGTGALAAFTARHYPAHYPAHALDVATLRRDLAPIL